MRGILFRAKRRDDNREWIEGFYVRCRGYHYILPVYDCDYGFDERYADWMEVDPKTICQYTGMTDKNGRKIFEGDIVGFEGEVAQIRFGSYKSWSWEPVEHCGFYVDWKSEREFRKDLGCWAHEAPAEIVGNIYDNPELCKREK